MRASDFGLGMKVDGYNLFVAGPPATGKTSTMRTVLQRVASRAPTPPDYCYVYNFEDPYRPRAIELPAGQGRVLRDAMQRLVEATRARLPRTFEEEEFARREAAIEEQLKRAEHDALAEVELQARRDGFAVLRTQEGMTVVYAPKGTPFGVEEFAALPAEERDRIEALAEALNGRVGPAALRVQKLEREAQQAHDELVGEAIGRVLGELQQDLERRFANAPAVRRYLDDVRRDLLAHAELFRVDGTDASSDEDTDVDGDGVDETEAVDKLLDRYRVNVLVDRSGMVGAPVITEENPTYRNLVGRFEHRFEQGALVTDFSMIKAGALAQANGGYFLLEASALLEDEVAWEALKRALKSRSIRMEEPIEEFRLLSAASLQPETIPLACKVVLVGTPEAYEALYEIDGDFRELWKVKVEFDESLPRTPQSERELARFVTLATRTHALRPLSASGMARLIEEGSRQVAHQLRLSARLGDIVDLLREANYWAEQRQRAIIEAEDLVYAIAQKVERSNLVEEQLARLTDEGQIQISTTGERVGQCNGVAVLSLGGYEFGRPLRISARVRPAARAGILDVEREVGLGGPVHTKGVLVLTGYLAGRYAIDRPMAMSASLVAEQSYDGVEGDSASLAELCALLSAIAEVPLRQGFAVTGSLDQHGRVQAVGGVNQKVEGFFTLCRTRGFPGPTGVLVPESNLQNLMLNDDVVLAAERGQFTVYAVRTIDEALELLTGQPAGERDGSGAFPPGTINARVEERLRQWALHVAEVR